MVPRKIHIKQVNIVGQPVTYHDSRLLGELVVAQVELLNRMVLSVAETTKIRNAILSKKSQLVALLTSIAWIRFTPSSSVKLLSWKYQTELWQRSASQLSLGYCVLLEISTEISVLLFLKSSIKGRMPCEPIKFLEMSWKASERLERNSQVPSWWTFGVPSRQ